MVPLRHQFMLNMVKFMLNMIKFMLTMVKFMLNMVKVQCQHNTKLYLFSKVNLQKNFFFLRTRLHLCYNSGDC